MTKYNIRIYQNDKMHPSVFEGADGYHMEKGIWLVVKWSEGGKTAFVNVSTARKIDIEEVDGGDEYYDMLEQNVGDEVD